MKNNRLNNVISRKSNDYLIGSVTLFMSMIIMMITSLGFTLLEASRYVGVNEKAKEVTAAACDSTFSEYIKPLYEQYGILGVDMSACSGDDSTYFIENRILEFANNSVSQDIDYFHIDPISCNIPDYMLLTDNDGAAFIHEAAIYYKNNVGVEIIEAIENQSDTMNNYEESSKDVEGFLEQGNSVIKDSYDVKKISNETSNRKVLNDTQRVTKDSLEQVEVKLSDAQVQKGETLIDDVGQFKSKGILEQVVPGGKDVSDKVFDVNNSVSNRNLCCGNSSNSSKCSLADKAIFSMYLKDKFSYFGRNLMHDGQQYELEYIVCGKESDRENLEGVVNRIIAIREVTNFAAIIKDPIKKSEALELATALSGFTLNPIIVEAVEYGLIAAWAYMESVLDVRLLLSGGKVSVVKSEAEWTSGLYNLANVFDNNYLAKNCEVGMDYSDYLVSFMILESNKTQSYRALDMMENSLNAMPYYENVKMDHLICDMNMELEYVSDPMFFSLVTLDVTFLDFYELIKKEYRTYL